MEFARDSYFQNQTLYSLCLNDKKRSEEIHIQLIVDAPLTIPPLSEALYMGRSSIVVPEEEEDEDNQHGDDDE